jgi:hypothetical protein
MLDLKALEAQFLGKVFDTRTFVLDADAMLTVATASGELLPRFVDAQDPAFQASPAFLGSLASNRQLPLDFPALDGVPMDGGKAVTCLGPVRPGVELVGESHLHQIYDKSGRSGRMVFIVSRMELRDPEGTHLATIDNRMVIREKSTP